MEEITNYRINMLNPKSKYYQIPNNFQIPNPNGINPFGILSLGFIW
jgi:hypothetical protein